MSKSGNTTDITTVEYSNRLNKACDLHPLCPALYHGRTRWISEKAKVTPQAARKWLAAESKPRALANRKLAAALGVDEAWLAVGTGEISGRAEKRAQRAHQAGAAASVLSGLIQLAGGSVAFPSEDQNTNALPHFYAIIDGRQYNVYVALGEEESAESVSFTVPAARDSSWAIVGCLPTDSTRCVFYRLSNELLGLDGESVNDKTRLRLAPTNKGLVSGSNINVQPISDLATGLG